MLHPRITVLQRPDGSVQLGWDPEHAVIMRAPGPPDAVSALLRLLDGVRTRQQILYEAKAFGFEGDTAGAMLDEMAAAGLLLFEQASSRLRSVRIHGRGPLADALLDGVRRIGLRPSHSHEGSTGILRGTPPDLMVLTDALMPDPALVEQLMRLRIPHLQVRIRDGRGVVGPLVLPGETSCLRCADLHRCDHDPQWPHLCAQLLGRVGYGSPADIAAAAALALKEIETIAHGSADQSPATLNTTLELDLEAYRLERRPWPVHRLCGCVESEVATEAEPMTDIADEIDSGDTAPEPPSDSKVVAL